jgi:hypothetical protein
MRKVTALLAIFLLAGCEEQPASRPLGRYQIVKDVYSYKGKETFALLDTELGQVWMFVDEKDNPPVLFPIPIVDDAALLGATGKTVDEFSQAVIKNAFEREEEKRLKAAETPDQKKDEGKHE